MTIFGQAPSLQAATPCPTNFLAPMTHSIHSIVLGAICILVIFVIRNIRHARTINDAVRTQGSRRGTGAEQVENKGTFGTETKAGSSFRIGWTWPRSVGCRDLACMSPLNMVASEKSKSSTMEAHSLSSIHRAQSPDASSSSLLTSISPYSSRSSSPCPSDASVSTSDTSSPGAPPSHAEDREVLDPAGSIVSPLTCTYRSHCVVHPDPPVPSSTSIFSLFPPKTQEQSHDIYYELHGTGPRKVIMIMGLGNTSLAYAGQVRGIIPPVRSVASGESRQGMFDEDEGETFAGMDIDAMLSSIPTGLSTPTSQSAPDTSYVTPAPDSWGKDYTICVFDNRGIGRSGSPGGTLDWRTKCMAKDVLKLLDHLGWVEEGTLTGSGIPAEKGKGKERAAVAEDEKVHIVGTSLGGMISLELATMIPDRIASLTLCVTTAGSSWKIGNLPSWASIRRMIQTFYEKDTTRKAQILFDLCFPLTWLDRPHPTLSATSNREHMLDLLRYRETVEQRPAAMSHWNQTFAALTHHVSADRLQELKRIPKVCVLTGGEDHLVAPENSEYLGRVIPGAELVVWEDAGHAINIQFPDRYNELLRRVWKGHD